MTRIVFTSLFTPNPDKLTLFCLAENWPEEPQYCPEYKGNRVACSAGRYRGLIHCACTDMHKEYESARSRALQEAVPFEDQDYLKRRAYFSGDYFPDPDMEESEKGLREWQPGEGDNWKVPEGLGWEKVTQSRRKRNPGAAIGPQEWCNLHPSDTYGANSFYIEYREVIRLKAAEEDMSQKQTKFVTEVIAGSYDISGQRGFIRFIFRGNRKFEPHIPKEQVIQILEKLLQEQLTFYGNPLYEEYEE